MHEVSKGHNGNYVTFVHNEVMFDVPVYESSLDALLRLTLPQLKDKAKALKVRRYSNMRHYDLANFLRSNYLNRRYERAKEAGYACGMDHTMYGARSCPRCKA